MNDDNNNTEWNSVILSIREIAKQLELLARLIESMTIIDETKDDYNAEIDF